MEEQTVVAAEPRLFVGQVPASSTEDQVRELFQQYGSVSAISMPGKPQSANARTRYAMVTFERWAEAEAACAEDKQCHLGGDKPLVVRFADPPKQHIGTEIKGIVPKKLFVGQIPKVSTNSEVKAWFEPYGDITSFVFKRNTNAAPIAFVGYRTWAAAEAAIAAVHGTQPVDDAPHPLVVKFADAKSKGGQAGEQASAVGVKRGFEAGGMTQQKRLNVGMESRGLQAEGTGMGMMAPQMGGTFSGARSMDMLQGGMGGMGFMGAGMGSGMGSGMRGMGLGSDMSGMPPGYLGMGGMGGMGGMAASMGGGMGVMGGLGSMASGMGGMANMGGMAGSMGSGMAGLRGLPAGMMAGSMLASDVSDDMRMAGMGMMGGSMPHMMMADSAMAHGMREPGYAGMGMMRGGMHHHMGGGGDGGMAHAAGAKNCPWKLFVGQLPYAAQEQDLIMLFSRFGDIVDAKVLRKPDTNQSKGCGFVTFAKEHSAAVAIDTVNQQMYLPGYNADRLLIVHYANRKGVSGS